MRRPEILSPAGDLEKMIVAFEYGADAVYAAGKDFGLRSSAGNFTDVELEKAVGIARTKGKKIYITANIFPGNRDIPAMEKHMAYLNKLKVDAVIISDLGVFSLAREFAPDIPVHISVQANNLNYREVRAWKEMGASRVILARELSLDEIIEIRRQVPDIELEVFVHGAICISLSGRCLLSDYMAGRGANKGECAQSCRWSYMLVEEKRKGEYLPVIEDARGTYILNSKDLCTIGYMPELINAGIDSFKIEGRMKSAHYVAVTTATYKKAVDSYVSSPDTYEFDVSLYSELEKVSHREYFSGFYFENGKTAQDNRSSKYISTFKFTGYVKETSGSGVIKCDIKNTLKLGDNIEIFTPEGKNISTKISGIIGNDGTEEIYAKQDKEYAFKIESKEIIKAYSMIRQEEKAE